MFKQFLLKYKRAKDQFWLPNEIKFDVDELEWTSMLSEGERHLMSRIITFMVLTHSAVDCAIVDRFCREVGVLEATFFFDLQTVV